MKYKVGDKVWLVTFKKATELHGACYGEDEYNCIQIITSVEGNNMYMVKLENNRNGILIYEDEIARKASCLQL